MFINIFCLSKSNSEKKLYMFYISTKILIPRFSFIKLFRDMFLISCLHKNNYENNLFCFYERIIKEMCILVSIKSLMKP